MNKTETAEKLKEARVRKGMTQVQVAEKIGRSPKLVGHWETGYSQPDVETLSLLLQLYEVDANSFYGIEKAPVRELVLNKEEEELIRLYRQCGKDDRKCALQVVRNFAALEGRRIQERPDNQERKEQLHEYLQESAKQYSQRERQDALNKQ